MGTSTQFIGEIHLFAGNFAPTGWAFCDGQVLPINQNQALFAVLGTTYGGNGVSNFALPDLRGRAPIHVGQGPGLSNHDLGSTGGVEAVTLTTAEMGAHSHTVACSTAAASSTPASGLWAPSNLATKNYATPGNGGPTTTMAAGMIAPAGGNQPHNNMQPTLVLNYIIALQGAFPPHP